VAPARTPARRDRRPGCRRNDNPRVGAIAVPAERRRAQSGGRAATSARAPARCTDESPDPERTAAAVEELSRALEGRQVVVASRPVTGVEVRRFGGLTCCSSDPSPKPTCSACWRSSRRTPLGGGWQSVVAQPGGVLPGGVLPGGIRTCAAESTRISNRPRGSRPTARDSRGRVKRASLRHGGSLTDVRGPPEGRNRSSGQWHSGSCAVTFGPPRLEPCRTITLRGRIRVARRLVLRPPFGLAHDRRSTRWPAFSSVGHRPWRGVPPIVPSFTWSDALSGECAAIAERLG
jgi:hypothetical protein